MRAKMFNEFFIFFLAIFFLVGCASKENEKISKEKKYDTYQAGNFNTETKTGAELKNLFVFKGDNESDIKGLIEKNLDKPLYWDYQGYNVLEYQDYINLNYIAVDISNTPMSEYIPLVIQGTAFRFDADTGVMANADEHLGNVETEHGKYNIVYKDYNDGYVILSIINNKDQEAWFFLNETVKERKDWYIGIFDQKQGIIGNNCVCGCDDCETTDDCDGVCEDDVPVPSADIPAQ